MINSLLRMLGLASNEGNEMFGPAPVDYKEPVPAKKEPVKKGFSLKCPECAEQDYMGLNLEDLTIRCNRCDSEFTQDEVKKDMREWKKFLDWLEDDSKEVIVKARNRIREIMYQPQGWWTLEAVQEAFGELDKILAHGE